MSDDEQITLPKVVLQAVFDIITGSMDFGSGFLDDEDQEHLVTLARAIGVDPMEGVQAQFRCKYRGRAAGQAEPIHDLCDWYTDPWRKVQLRYCRDCAGGREERPIPPEPAIAHPTVPPTGFRR